MRLTLNKQGFNVSPIKVAKSIQYSQVLISGATNWWSRDSISPRLQRGRHGFFETSGLLSLLPKKKHDQKKTKPPAHVSFSPFFFIAEQHDGGGPV